MDKTVKYYKYSDQNKIYYQITNKKDDEFLVWKWLKHEGLGFF